MREQRARLSRHDPVAKALDDMLTRWRFPPRSIGVNAAVIIFGEAKLYCKSLSAWVTMRPLIPAIVGAVVCMATPAFAQEAWLSPDRFAVGATAGTDGVGGELQYSLNRYLVLRGRGTWLEFGYGGNSGEVHYDVRARLSEGSGFADLHPFANPFVVSVGAVAGPRRADVSLAYRKNVTFDGVSLTPEQLGTGAGRASLGSPAPSVGLGFDNTFTHAGHWGFKLTAGVAFGHAPDATLYPVSGLALQQRALIAPYVAEVEHDVRHDGGFLAYYPQVSAGVNYRF